MRFITTSHATVKDGNIYEAPANFVVETLISFKEPFMFIRHSIDGNIDSIAYDYSADGSKKETVIFVKEPKSIVRYLKEIFQTIKYLLARHDVSKSETIYVGVDPLNCLI